MSPIRVYTAHRDLIHALVARQVQARYKGSVLGLAWLVLRPLLLLAVFTFVFSVVFQARWDRPVENQAQFALLLYAGLVCHQMIAECLTRSPNAMVEFTTYVKKVVFPVEILPMVVAAQAVVGFGIGFALLLAAQALLLGGLPITVIAAPLVILPLALFGLAIGWALAGLGPYFRDLAPLAGLASLVLMFLSPVFYPLSAVPEGFRWVIGANPLAFVIEQLRLVAVFGVWPDWAGLALFGLAAFGLATLALALFGRLRPGFADVL